MGDVPAPQPARKSLRVAALEGAAIKAIDAAEVSERLVRTLEAPKLHRQILDDDADVQGQLEDGGVVVRVPRADVVLARVHLDDAAVHRVVPVSRHVEVH